MGIAQRYVSDELTHFVGRGLPEPQQYDLLLHVLRTGRLSPPPHDGNERGDVEIHLDRPISGNGAYEPQAVCFCDIPIGDLHLHIRKYSPFGLAFRKPQVVEAGANPVFYVARASTTWMGTENGAQPIERAVRFDSAVRAYQRARAATEKRLGQAPTPEDADLHEEWLRLAHFLDMEVLSFLKFFEYADDEEPDNYYMEREWRLLGSMSFRIEDVRRIVLPERYAHRLRQELPEYAGQVTFAEGFG